ncbi:MAG: serine protease [Bacteroidia bacterium]|nr:serine protease [Bacteroidia bacterium]
MRLYRTLGILLLILLCSRVWADNIVLPPVASRANNQAVSPAADSTYLHTTLHFAEKYDINTPLSNGETQTYTSEGAYSMSALINVANVNKFDSIVVASYNKKATYRPKAIVNGKIITGLFDGATLSITHYGQDPVEIEYICTGIMPIPGQRIAQNKDSQYGKSWRCMVNAVCDERTEIIRRSVCRLIVGGTELGTGTLINNANEDKRPYVLTAAHVFNRRPDATIQALFGFEVESCMYPTEPDEANTHTINGLKILCYYPEYDIALFELTETPSETVNPYWSGWDITGEIDDQAEYTCIHQPYGDVRKVSIGTNIKLDDYSITGATPPEGGSFARNIHYNIQTWTIGTTQGGSSGSGLWNTDNKLIGTLSGGYGSCSYLGDDYYAALAKAWDKKKGEYMSLQEVLDPDNIGLDKLTGRDLYSKESATTETECEDQEVTIVRENGSATILANNISDIKIYSLDGRLLDHTKVDTQGQNEITVNTTNWTNKLILITVKYNCGKEETIKIKTK